MDQNGWISVKDRLPKLLGGKSSEVVLIAKKFKSENKKGLTVAMGWVQWMPDDSFVWVDVRLGFPPPVVTHWMPLPDPPGIED